MNKVIKGLLLVMIILFLSLYFSRYFIGINENKTVLTDEAIMRFEKDLKKGKKINPNDYIVKENDYNNKACKIGLRISWLIENTFKNGFRFVLRYLNDNG